MESISVAMDAGKIVAVTVDYEDFDKEIMIAQNASAWLLLYY